MKETIYGFYPSAADVYAKQLNSYDAELLHRPNKLASAFKRPPSRTADAHRPASTGSIPSKALSSLSIEGVGVQVPSAAIIRTPCTPKPPSNRAHQSTQMPSAKKRWHTNIPATSITVDGVTRPEVPRPCTGATTSCHGDGVSSSKENNVTKFDQTSEKEFVNKANECMETSHRICSAPIPRPPQSGVGTRQRPASSRPSTRPLLTGKSYKSTSSRRPQSAPMKVYSTSVSEKEFTLCGESNRESDKHKTKDSRNADDVIDNRPHSASSHASPTRPSPCTHSKIPTPFESDIPEETIEPNVSDEREKLVRDDYDRELSRQGWRMEVPGDPLGLKKKFVQDRKSYAVTCPVPDVLPKGPSFRSECFETFFYNTIPRRRAAFTISKEWASEIIHAQRMAFQKKQGGKINYNYKNFAFIY